MVVGEHKNHILTIIVATFIIIIICSGCISIKCPYIPDVVINNGWYENLSLRNTGTQFLGLEKWCCSVYEINGKYPATLTVTILKTLILTDEKELYKKIIGVIEDTFKDTIKLNESTKLKGSRTLEKNHQTLYILYDGISINKNEKIKIIGEVWNCGNSGISIISLGIAYITHNEDPIIEYTDNWQKIVMDPRGIIGNFTGEEGLIYNIYCH